MYQAQISESIIKQLSKQISRIHNISIQIR